MAKKKRKVGQKKRKGVQTYLGITMLAFLIAIVVVTLILNYKKEGTEKVAKPKEEVKEVEQVNKVEEAILHAAEQLGVPSNLVKKNVRGDEIRYTISLDGDKLDLNFANMIFTGQIEIAGGVIESGETINRGAGQVLKVKDPKLNKTYVITLVYDRAKSYTEKRLQLAIVVDDFGEFSGALLDDWLNTDPNVTFAILPDLKHSTTVMEKANAMGRETMLHLPMEPIDYPRNNPGDSAVLVENSDREIIRITEGHLKQLSKVKGVNNHMGSLATADERVMSAVLDVIKKNNLYFVDSKTTVHSVGLDLAQRKMIPAIARDLFLDAPNTSEKTVRERVNQLKNMKGNKERVVVITHCFDRERIKGMNMFIEEAKKLGYEIVPVSKLFETGLPEII
ncbi:MAG: divergent polysaccharide deacetylase family protein [Candidatus Cloacimonas sp.]|nr:divergent polysaccharide deacetylase family protein [Candidatus Cloacimonadota bacterium]